MKKSLAIFAISLTLATTNVNAAFVVNKNTIETTATAISSTNVLTVEETKVTNKEEIATSVAAVADSGKNQIVAMILALVSVIFIPIGLHRFYLGKSGSATAQLLMTIPGFILILPLLTSWGWQVVDLIRIITGDLKPENGDYAKK